MLDDHDHARVMQVKLCKANTQGVTVLFFELLILKNQITIMIKSF